MPLRTPSGSKNFFKALKSLSKFFSDQTSDFNDGSEIEVEMNGDELAGMDRLELKGEIGSADGLVTQNKAICFKVGTSTLPCSKAMM